MKYIRWAVEFSIIVLLSIWIMSRGYDHGLLDGTRDGWRDGYYSAYMQVVESAKDSMIIRGNLTVEPNTKLRGKTIIIISPPPISIKGSNIGLYDNHIISLE